MPPVDEKAIVDYIIKCWKGEFVGVSALSLTEVFSLPHEEIVALLEGMRFKNLVHLRKAHLSLLTISLEKANRSRGISDEYKEVETVIAFPNRSILEKVFESNGIDYGIY